MNMNSFDESTIGYDYPALDHSVLELARTVPGVMGGACEDEVYLCSNLLNVRKVNAESAQQSFHYGQDVQLVDHIIRVDYEFWTAIPQFDAAAPEHVTHRREHLYVRTSVLARGELFVYGLGPEFGFEEWVNDDTTEGTPEQTGLPEDGYTALLNEISSNHLTAIGEYLVDDEEELPTGIRPAMQKLYLDTAKARKASDKAWAQEEIKREAERQLTNPSLDLKSLQFTRHKDRLILQIHSKERQFIWTMSVQMLEDQHYPLIELSKGKKVPSPLNYVPVSKVIVKSPCLMSSDTAENALRDLLISGWLQQQLDGLI
jgi:hypothetical protein